jgi:hypothetical protein
MPFLYQTRTIQQNAVQRQRWPHSEQSSSKSPSDHVPFENGEDMRDVNTGPNEKTTITNTEKVVFERLFHKVSSTTNQNNAAEENATSSSTADSHSTSTPPSLQEQRPSIDPIAFPVPLQQMAATAAQKLRAQHEEARLRQVKTALTAAWQQAEAKKAKKRPLDPVEEKILAERERVQSHIETANTDVNLWRILEDEAFSQIEALDLDGLRLAEDKKLQATIKKAELRLAKAKGELKTARAAEMKEIQELELEEAKVVPELEGELAGPTPVDDKSKQEGNTAKQISELAQKRVAKIEGELAGPTPVDAKSKQKGNTAKQIAESAQKRVAKIEKEIASLQDKQAEMAQSRKSADLTIIGPNYPTFLTTAIITLRTCFPTSTLSFTMLSKLKSLGRGSYALGASTALYNELIKAIWHTYSDFRYIDELLQEMDNGGLEFDLDTLKILEEIRLEGNRIKNGRYGINRRAVWNTDIIQNGWRKVILWIPVVKERVEADTQRKLEEMAENQEVVEIDEDFDTEHVPDEEDNGRTEDDVVHAHAS